MSEVIAGKIQRNPKYRDLVKQRDALAWILSALVLILYFGFILMVAFAGDFLAQPIGPDSVIPVGVPIGVAVIFLSCVLTGVYVYRANTTFDAMVRDIIQEASK